MIEVRVESSARLALHGVLDFTSARRTHEAGLVYFSREPGANWVVDCAGLESANSAALAVLLDWLRQRSGQGAHLRYESLPARLGEIARLSGTLGILEAGV